MAKKFDIHEWKAQQQMKQWLREAEEFTPDLEDDDLKRSKIQQMMDKEKSKTPQDVPRGTLNNTIADLAEMYSYGEILDSLKVFYTDNDELPFAEMAKKHAKEFRDFLDNDELNEVEIKKVIDQSMDNDAIGKLQDVIRNYDLGKVLNTIAVIIDRTGGMPDGAAQMVADIVPKITPEELDEMNSLGSAGSGASFSAGDGMGHFGKSKKKRKKTRSGYMGYSEPVNEQEEPEVDDEGNPIEPEQPSDKVDTTSELAAKFKDIGSALKKPAGSRGIDKSEIEQLDMFLDKLLVAAQEGNATGLLKKVNNLMS